jgi:hypothetical protein
MWHIFCDCKDRLDGRLKTIEKHLAAIGVDPYPHWYHDYVTRGPRYGKDTTMYPLNLGARIDRLYSFLGLRENKVPSKPEQIIIEKIEEK